MEPRSGSLFQLQVRQQMRIRVQRQLDGRVPEQFLHDFGMFPSGKQDGGARMPQIVKANARQRLRLHECVELSTDITLIERCADRAREDDARLSPTVPSHKLFALLGRAMLRQKRRDARRNGDDAIAGIALWLNKTELCRASFHSNSLERAADEDRALLQVGVLPLEAERLAKAHTKGQHRHVQRTQSMACAGPPTKRWACSGAKMWTSVRLLRGASVSFATLRGTRSHFSACESAERKTARIWRTVCPWSPSASFAVISRC